MKLNNQALVDWLSDSTALFEPDCVVWVDGSAEQYQTVCDLLVQQGRFIQVDSSYYPNSYWCHSELSDVARVEDRTFICTSSIEQVGPTNNWMSAELAKEKLHSLMSGCMRGRTMYVVPYMMGPAGSAYSKIGFELTDSAYVVANMYIMARVGDLALRHLGDSSDFIRGWHSYGTLSALDRYVCHFPESKEIISFNSDYGGNALQGKKCFALRLASVMGQQEGWLAEHMLIMGITNPDGERIFIAAAFPSACGKTNLAMLVPPKDYQAAGWKVETVGDDIAWIHIGKDGKFYAINPERGFFGVAPGTSNKTNPSMISALAQGNSIFTNTAFDPVTKLPWWEGSDREASDSLHDWQGQPWKSGDNKTAAHANSRFTTPASQCPSISDLWESPEGVPISAIIFGGRRSEGVPLVLEARDWTHAVYLGSVMSSEKTAAAIGSVGEVRIDPMAMLPFCGYHMAEYFSHWLSFNNSAQKCPKVFQVNWFRKNSDGKYLWPGFGDNLRVLEWVFKRVTNKVDSDTSLLGQVPFFGDINLRSLNVTEADWTELFAVDREFWKQELLRQKEFYFKLGAKLPQQLQDILEEQIRLVCEC